MYACAYVYMVIFGLLSDSRARSLRKTSSSVRASSHEYIRNEVIKMYCSLPIGQMMSQVGRAGARK